MFEEKKIRKEVRTLIEESFDGDTERESVKAIFATLMQDFASWKQFLNEVWAGRFVIEQKDFEVFKKIVFEELER
jgi:hypothetical protein